MASLIQTIIVSTLKHMVPSSNQTTYIYNNIMESIGLLLTLSALLSTTILLVCLGLAYYLWELHFTFWQLLGVILTIKFFLLLLFILCFRSVIQKMKDSNANSNNSTSKKSNYHLLDSFIDGFNEKK